MRWTYDPTIDALTIELRPTAHSTRTSESEPGILVDYDRADHPVAIEILDASRHFSRRELEHLPLPESMLPLSRAAKRAGLSPATLRQQIRRKRLRATKHHREWWVDPDALQEYLDGRAPQGRRRRGSSRDGGASRPRRQRQSS